MLTTENAQEAVNKALAAIESGELAERGGSVIEAIDAIEGIASGIREWVRTQKAQLQEAMLENNVQRVQSGPVVVQIKHKTKTQQATGSGELLMDLVESCGGDLSAVGGLLGSGAFKYGTVKRLHPEAFEKHYRVFQEPELSIERVDLDKLPPKRVANTKGDG